MGGRKVQCPPSSTSTRLTGLHCNTLSYSVSFLADRMFYLDCNKFRFIMTVRTPYWDCWSSGTQWAIKVSRLDARLQENRNKMDKFVQHRKFCLQHQCVKDFISDVWHYKSCLPVTGNGQQCGCHTSGREGRESMSDGSNVILLYEWLKYPFLGTIGNLGKVTISFVMSVCPSAVRPSVRMQ
jgi:hypothetical protein